MEVRDPVCGMEFEAEEAAVRAEYDDTVYYFCSKGCRSAFLRDPERYREPTD